MLPDVERRKRTLGPLHFFAGCVFAFYSVSLLRGTHTVSVPYWAIVILTGVWIALFAVIGKRMFPQEKEYAATSRNLRWLESVLFLLLALFVFWHHTAYFHGVVLLCWCLAFAFMGWTERSLFEPTFVNITEKGIGVPGMGSIRWIAWNQISGVALRPDFFTIYLPGNRDMQFEVVQLMLDAEIMEINEFCSSMLKQNTPS
jgi:DNA-binding transcriptional regulator of glucitol operon